MDEEAKDLDHDEVVRTGMLPPLNRVLAAPAGCRALSIDDVLNEDGSARPPWRDLYPYPSSQITINLDAIKKERDAMGNLDDFRAARRPVDPAVRPMSEMTGEMAVSMIEREARTAGVDLPGLGDKRDIIVNGLDANPEAIPFFVEKARQSIAEAS